MSRRVQDGSQYAFNFSRCYLEDSVGSDPNTFYKDGGEGVVVRFVDAKTRAVREDALRRLEANGIFRTSGKRSNS